MERETKIKIIGTAVFIILLLGTAYLIYHTNKIENNEIIELIKVTGNSLLNENDYLTFTRLNDLSKYKELSLPVIKSRFEKHPYVMMVDVKFVNEKEVKVFLTEKKIYAVIICANEPLFISENYQVLPVFQNTKMFDIPVLSNLDGSKNLITLKKFSNDDMIQAFRIIDASGLTDSKMLKDLAEINLRNGGDVVLTFSGMNVPVIFGRGNEAAKTVYLETLLTNFFDKNNFLSESDYIDLRFNSKVFVGKMKKTEL